LALHLEQLQQIQRRQQQQQMEMHARQQLLVQQQLVLTAEQQVALASGQPWQPSTGVQVQRLNEAIQSNRWVATPCMREWMAADPRSVLLGVAINPKGWQGAAIL
jgi:type II secretory pathway pseudopilin PulG